MISLLIFIVQLFIFATIAFTLHYYSPRLGLTPLLFFVAGLMGILNIIELNSLVIQPISGLELRPGGHVYVPLVLMILLLLYVTNGTRPTQVTVYGITGINVLVLLVLGFLVLYIEVRDPSTVISGGLSERNVLSMDFLRGVIASLVAFFADMFVIIITYQGVLNAFRWIPRWLIPTIALVIAMWTDTAVFNLLALVGTERFMFQISGDIVMKTVAAILLSIPTSYYLHRIAPLLPDYIGADGRRTLEILYSTGGKISEVVKALEAELFISRSTYNQIISHIGEVFWLVDVKTRRFIYISPAFERITGYRADVFYKTSQAFLDILHPDDRQTDYPGGVVDYLIATEEAEFRIIKPDKSERLIRSRSFPIKNDAGEIIRYAGIAEDITDIRRVSEQAFELAMTREKMRYLYEFIRDASHDLKNPLSAMMIKLDLIERINDETRQEQLLEEVRERALHLTALIDDLFTLSHIESREDIEMAPVDLNTIIGAEVRRHQPLADKKQLLIFDALCEPPCKLIGIRDQLQRLAGNLISNAIRYTDEGKIEIKTWQDDNHVYFSVADSGIGIPAHDLARVFDRFYRTKNARDSNQEGTGLGLAISKAIVEQHHGQIVVDSVLNEGTTFTVMLPLKPPSVAEKTDVRRTNQEFRPVKSE